MAVLPLKSEKGLIDFICSRLQVIKKKKKSDVLNVNASFQENLNILLALTYFGD